MNIRPCGAEQEFGLAYINKNGKFVKPVPDKQETVVIGIIRALASRAAAWQSKPGRWNIWLPNGARTYIDTGNHVEYAIGECSSLEELVAHILAGRHITAEACTGLRLDHLKNVARVVVVGTDYAQNDTDTDLSLKSFGGCHESYAVENGWLRDVIADNYPTGRSKSAVYILASHFASRIIYTGNGFPVRRGTKYRFFLSSRIPFITELRSSSTTLARPFIHLRNEPHTSDASSEGTFRLHLICANPNVSQVAMLLTFGTTSLLLRLAEEHPERFLALPAFTNPVATAHAINKNLRMSERRECTDDVDRTGLALQHIYWEAVADAFSDVPEDPAYVQEQTAKVLALWEENIISLAEDPFAETGLRDWTTKYRLFEEILAKHDVRGHNSVPEKLGDGLMYLDGLYHMVTLEEGNAAVAQRQRDVLVQLVEPERVTATMYHPPGMMDFPPIRSMARGNLLELLDAYGIHAKNVVWEGIIVESQEETNEGKKKTEKIKLDYVGEDYTDIVEVYRRRLKTTGKL